MKNHLTTPQRRGVELDCNNITTTTKHFFIKAIYVVLEVTIAISKKYFPRVNSTC